MLLSLDQVTTINEKIMNGETYDGQNKNLDKN